MKIFIAFCFILLTTSLQAQINEEFNDGNFTQNPTWSGDASQFAINANYQLQLISAGSDSSYMSFSSQQNAADSLQWEIWIQQSFSPSSQNYGRIYLSSDNANLESPLNGYYIQLGESGSNDALTIFKQTGYMSTPICRGFDATISSAFTVRIKVIKTSNGEWKLYTDYTGGRNFNEEATGIDNSLINFTYFGIKDVYTSSNATKFYYDHIYVGAFLADTLKPRIASINIVDSTKVRVYFTEKIRNTDANNPAHYYINGNMVSSSIQDSSMTSILLTSSQIFVTPNDYQLTAYQIHDLEGNLTLIDSINFKYLKTDIISKHDLIINEIMSDPSGANNLPFEEYIEIYNRSPKYINSIGYIITDGNTDAILPSDTIEPEGYRVYFNNSHAVEFAQFQISNTKGLATFPGLNNDGDHITLKDQQGNTIDKISYSLNSYHDKIKETGGWSIERKDPEFTCINEENWQASKDHDGGTPGKENSEIVEFIDNKPPDILYITVTDSLNIEIHYDEVPEASEASSILNYTINDGNAVIEARAKTEDESTYVLKLTHPMQRQIIYKLKTSNISDCTGNKMQNTNEINFGIGEEIRKGELLINELLFNPAYGQYDYIELFNNSNKIISLSNLKLAQNDLITSEIKSTSTITVEKRVVCPGEYLVISESTSFMHNYKNFSHRCAIQTNIPSMNDDEGVISLLSPSMDEVDNLHYTEKMQYPLLANVEGVSLERINPSGPSNDGGNWHSASYQCGFGTPGSLNSQLISNTEIVYGLTIEPAIISPDNDGENDIAMIKVIDITGTGTINILNESGKEIRKIAEGEYLGINNIYLWDGSNKTGLIVPAGIYIISAEIIDEKGNVLHYKKPIVIAQKITNIK